MVTDHSASGTSSGSGSICTEQSGTSSGSSGSVRRRRKKKRLAHTLSAASFNDLYSLKGEELGHGSYGRVETCINLFTGVEYAVKIVDKDSWQFQRQKMLKEIELYHFCQGHDSIIQLIEYFEEDDHFYLIFEKAQGGHLLKQINQKLRFDEKNAAKIVAKLAKALKYLHSKGIAHRDLKPENVLCMEAGDADQVASSIRLCDFDLCSNIHPTVTTPRLQSPVGSAEYVAPEVVDSFIHGEDCGWNDRNEECSRCQEDLFNSIKRGSLHFPDQYWSKISSDAKDLLIKLLQKDPNDRLEAAEILNHPWIIQMTKTFENNENNNNNKKLSIPAVHFDVSSPISSNNDENNSPQTTNITNNLRKTMSTHLWSPTMSQNRPAIRATNKMRRQSSVVEFYLQREDSYLSRCEY